MTHTSNHARFWRLCTAFMLLAGSALAAQATTWSINDQTVTEGGTATFTVTRANGTNGRMTINYATANGTAQSGSDYTASSGTLTFNNGVTTQTISVSTIQNTTPETTETFNVNLSNPSKGTISDAQVSAPSTTTTRRSPASRSTT